MLQATSAKRAVQCSTRRFSSTPKAAAVSPYRKTTQQPTQSQARTTRNVSDTATRSAQAVAVAHQRPVPSPAFNRDDDRLRDIQPLQPYRQQEMDHSFVGMKGGEIFHEMMKRQGVKHICMFRPVNGS